MLSYPHRGSILRELVRWQQRTTDPIKRGLSYPYATKLRTRLAGRGEVLGRRPSTPFFSKTPKLADWLQQPPNAASGGCQCRNAPQRVPARHPAPKTRCAALLAGVLGHRSQKCKKAPIFKKVTATCKPTLGCRHDLKVSGWPLGSLESNGSA